MNPIPEGEETSATILLVEDNLSTRMALEAMLDALGFRVLAAADPIEAQAIFTAQADTVDLLMSDLLLPHLSGPELYERLKQHKPALRCVIMSGYPLEEESARLQRRGIRYWIQKPFSMNDMKGLLETALRE